MKTIYKCLTSLALIFSLPTMAAPAETIEENKTLTTMHIASMQSDKLDTLRTHQSGCCCASCQSARLGIDQSTV
jgi:hypothetical protein